MVCAAFSALAAGWALSAAVLEGIAVLPAETFLPGPPSGQFLGDGNHASQALDGQPMQGFSAIVREDSDSFFVLSDNGFGSRENSPDYLLRIYSISPEFRTVEGGSGRIWVNGFINLHDPGRRIRFPLISERQTYGDAADGIPVDPAIKTQHLLTGADLDPESFIQAPDGSFWIGDEFGPFLVHVDASGKVLESPFQLNGLHSQGNPRGLVATLPRTKGFEGLAISSDGNFLFPMLEGAVNGHQHLYIYRFDIQERRFDNANAGEPTYRYALEPEATAIGDFTLANDTTGLIIERDSGQGDTAKFKKVFRVDLGASDDDNVVSKTEIADLLNIDDPHDLDGDGDTVFRFPFWTIEGIVVIDHETIGIVNDNNYPTGRGRNPGKPEDTEFILLRVEPLW